MRLRQRLRPTARRFVRPKSQRLNYLDYASRVKKLTKRHQEKNMKVGNDRLSKYAIELKISN